MRPTSTVSPQSSVPSSRRWSIPAYPAYPGEPLPVFSARARSRCFAEPPSARCSRQFWRQPDGGHGGCLMAGTLPRGAYASNMEVVGYSELDGQPGVGNRVVPDYPGHARSGGLCGVAHRRARGTMPPDMSEEIAVDFYFDVSCRWAWWTSIWLRRVARQQPINVSWKVFSLAVQDNPENYREPPARPHHIRDVDIHRAMVAARQSGGNTAVERLYRAY